MRGILSSLFLCIFSNLTTDNNVCYNGFTFENTLKIILNSRRKNNV